MIQLTEEQRKALIDEIDYNRKNCFLSDKTELLMQIAEAALTAKPVAVVVGKFGAGLKATCYEGAQRPVEGSKLYGEPPLPVVPDDLLAQFNRHRLLEIIVTGPDASGAEQNTLARIALAFYPPAEEKE